MLTTGHVELFGDTVLIPPSLPRVYTGREHLELDRYGNLTRTRVSRVFLWGIPIHIPLPSISKAFILDYEQSLIFLMRG